MAERSASSPLSTLLGAGLVLGLVAASGLLTGSLALQFAGEGLDESTRLGVAAGSAAVVAVLCPLLAVSRVLKALRDRTPRRTPIVLTLTGLWNASWLAICLAVLSQPASQALATHGDWVLLGAEQPWVTQALRDLASRIPGAGPLEPVAPIEPDAPVDLDAPMDPDAQERVDAVVDADVAQEGQPFVEPEGPWTARQIFAGRADAVVVIKTQVPLTPDHPFHGLFGMMGMSYAEGLGSGFVVSADGLIVTNHHVMDGADRARVLLRDGTVLEPVTILVADPTNDLALLQVPTHGRAMSIAPIAGTDDVAIGAPAYAIGSPLGLDYSLTQGIVSALRTLQGTDFLQMQTTIAPGSSGGPLFDENGQVMGVNTATTSPGLNLAVRASHVRSLLEAPVEPRELGVCEETVQVVDVGAEGAVMTPTQREQIEQLFKMVALKAQSCLDDLPEDAYITLRVTDNRWGRLASESNLGGSFEACLTGHNPGLMPLGLLVRQLNASHPEPVVLVATLEGVRNDAIEDTRPASERRILLRVESGEDVSEATSEATSANQLPSFPSQDDESVERAKDLLEQIAEEHKDEIRGILGQWGEDHGLLPGASDEEAEDVE